MTDDPLVAVLEKIAEIEARPGFEGPKIGRRLQLIRISAYADHGANGEEVFGDRVVGKIGRACDARGWALKIDGSYGDEEPYIVSVVVSCHPNHYKSHDSWGRSRAIAAASAYLKAIGGGDRE